jgi:localization factor PodJL
MHNLATMLASNLIGKPDYAAAFRWYNEAAQAGLRDSQFNLGVLLARGIGTKRDLVKAHQWYALAADQGDAEAAKRRDEIAGRLTPAELETARAAREGWHPRASDPVANEIGIGAVQRTAGLDQAAG